MSAACRSAVMAAIKSRGNKSTEIAMASLLRKARVTGWRRHVGMLGSPDFVWRKERVVLFVDGCFWHGCPRCYREPRSSIRYWRAKILRNQLRDRRNTKMLQDKGWRVVRTWECKLKPKGARRAVIRRLVRALGRERSSRL